MRAVMLSVPEDWLEERARLGLDRFDEMWEGELHMVPPPGYLHQTVGSDLHAFLKAPLRARGIELRYEMAVLRPGAGGKDYRAPDLLFFPSERTDLISHRGIEGGPLAVLEIRSPDDETYEKFDFYASLGIREVIVLDPDKRLAEVFRLVGKKYVATSSNEAGQVHAATIDVRFSTIPDGTQRFRVQTDGNSLDL